MSHISQGRGKIAFTDKNLLLKALEKVGRVEENTHLYVETGGGGHSRTMKKYDVVLISKTNKKHRIGFNKNSDGHYVPFEENWGDCGRWTRRVKPMLDDLYIGYHYEQQMQNEGFDVELVMNDDGTIEVEGVEQVW